MSRYFVENRFEYKGFPCVVILQGLGHRCGYVGIPAKNKLYGIDYNNIEVECHGGLTYSDAYLVGQDDDDAWWVGFDCAHSWDRPDFEKAFEVFRDDDRLIRVLHNMSIYPIYEHQKVRTQEYVEAECRSIVDQILELEVDNENL